uniref:FYVE-type domain-containing protein n=2 Tax=Octactis speculum TaxID=3111310 RepID=A0A7S2H4B3_9STRA|mmetsp:Transcript_61236/g.84102  ORF Transcript_61236/g.84102 Transcript_61236/m.84102 type:complete len:355 (+) Transcript_61236:1-1065(+)
MGTNEPDEDSKLAFTIRNPTKSFVVEAEEENEMRQWFDLIQAQIKSTCAAEEKPVDPHNITFAPVWLSNSAVKNCQICDRQFTLIKRRHHCRSCGKVVCGTCSNEKIRLQNIHESKFVRACTICYEENKKTRTYGVNTYAHQATSKDEVARLQAATPDVASSVAITPKSTDTIETPSMLPRYTSPQSLPSVALEQPTKHISKISSTSEATELVVTLFQYVSTEDGDLSLEVGEKIKVIKREVGGDENWMEGESARTGETGIFPASYVETVPAVATSSPLPISSSGASCVASTTGNVYSLAALKQDDLPFGVDKDRKEEYLSDGDFEQVFEMSKSSFQKLAKWQKSAKKKAVGLF